jgi:hypothetical protein
VCFANVSDYRYEYRYQEQPEPRCSVCGKWHIAEDTVYCDEVMMEQERQINEKEGE